MKIQYLSDLHLEFFNTGVVNVLASIIQEADVLVIAGDLGIYKDLYPAFKFLSPLYPHIVFVAGNHEYYHSSPPIIHKLLEDYQKEFKNLHWLNNSMIEIDGQRFLGGTGWFPNRPDNVMYKGRFSDFSAISNLEPFIYNQYNEFIFFLEENLKERDIVITHTLPSPKSTPIAFMHSELNRFFVCEEFEKFMYKEPSVWIHGHTHDSCSYELGKTRVVCNPFGYVGFVVNSNFNDNLILEV